MKEKNICSEHIPEVPKISFSSDISFPPPIAFSSPLDFGEQVSFIFRTDSEEITVDDVSKLQSFYSCSEGLNYLRGISRGLLQLSLSAYIAEETYIFRLENDWVIQGTHTHVPLNCSKSRLNIIWLPAQFVWNSVIFPLPHLLCSYYCRGKHYHHPVSMSGETDEPVKMLF